MPLTIFCGINFVKKKMRYCRFFILFFLLTLFCSVVFGQSDFEFWRNLRDVSYIEKNDQAVGKIKLPIFGEKVSEFENKTIFIKGYIMPLELGSDYFVISAYPFENCYFCGAAGPETVMEVFPTGEVPFSQTVTVRGTLKFNRDNIHRLLYRLENAAVVR